MAEHDLIAPMTSSHQPIFFANHQHLACFELRNNPCMHCKAPGEPWAK